MEPNFILKFTSSRDPLHNSERNIKSPRTCRPKRRGFNTTFIKFHMSYHRVRRDGTVVSRPSCDKNKY